MSRFWRDEAGSYAVIVAVALPAIVGAIGLATEMGIWAWQKQQMQQIADSAAYTAATASGAGETSDQAKADGLAVAFDLNNSANVTLMENSTTGAWTATAMTVNTRTFSSVFGQPSVTISATSKAASGHVGDGCVLALDPSSSGAYTEQGNPAVTLNKCSLFVDSSSSSGLSMGGSSSLTAASVYAVGGISGASSINANKFTGARYLSDQLAGKQYYDMSTATAQSQSKKSSTLDPGIYSSNITVKTNDNITMNPGVYYLVDGAQLIVQGQGTLTGTGVTIVLTKQNTSTYGSFKITGGSIDLTAPTSGSTAGFVVLADPTMPNSNVIDMTGMNSSYWGGLIYAPSATVHLTGGASSGQAYNCTKVIAYDISFYGNSSLSVTCPPSVPTFGAMPARIAQ